MEFLKLIYTGAYPMLAFALCVIATPLVLRMAGKRGWVAKPSKDRWHSKPTAVLGGIGIYFGFIIPIFIMSDFSAFFASVITTPTTKTLPPVAPSLFFGITLVFLLGLYDDFFHIKPHTKLLGQLLTALFVTFLGFRLNWFSSMTLDTIITIIWIVGITNAFNLLDNMDGLCAGVGLISSLAVFLLLNHDNPEVATMSLIFSGALIAFLIFNFNPASIFMGDCGSLPIGFALAFLCLFHSHAVMANPLAKYVVPVMILLVPIFDTTMVTLIRILSGRKASTGGKDHTSHRLVIMGFTEKGAVLFLYLICGISGVSALFVSGSDTFTTPAVIIPVTLSFLLLGIYLAQIRVYPEKEFSLLRGKSYTPILMELTYRRQIILVLLDFCIIIFTYYLSYRLRFDPIDFRYYFKVFLSSLPAVIACKFVAFFATGIYSGIWRYLSTNDVLEYLKASVLGTLLSVVAVTYIYRFEDFSKGIFVIDWFLTTGFLLGIRGSFRLFVDTMKRKSLNGEAVLIYGAGRGGEILLRELINNGVHKYRPIGFIDDNPLKKGKKIQGYTVMGASSDLETLIDKHHVSGLLISFNKNDPDHMSDMMALCRMKGLFLKKFSIQIKELEPEAYFDDRFRN